MTRTGKEGRHAFSDRSPHRPHTRAWIRQVLVTQGPVQISASPQTTAGPRLLGHLAALRHDPLGFLADVARRGDVDGFRLGRQRVFLVSDLEAIQDVLVTNSRLYAHETFVSARWLRQGRPPAGEGLAATRYETHLEQRRSLKPAFAQSRAAAFADCAVRHAVHACERWREGRALDVAAESSELSLAILLEGLFGSCATDVPTLAKSIRALAASFHLGQSRLRNAAAVIGSDVGRAAHGLAAIDATLVELLASRRGGSDLSSVLDGHAEQGARPPQDARTILMAGQVTAAAVLQWTWYLLARHSWAQAALEHEVDEVLAGRPPNIDDLPRLRFTRKLCAETLRLYPPNWYIGRRATVDTTLAGRPISAYSFILVSPYLVHRDRRWWPASERFDPERFAEEAQAARPKLAFIPFGAGTRRCIGERLAWAEQVLVTATVAQHWRLRLPAGARVVARAGAGLEPRDGLTMLPERRRQRFFGAGRNDAEHAVSPA
jgi:cytochrome P450